MLQALNEIHLENDQGIAQQFPEIGEEQIVPLRSLIQESSKLLKQLLASPVNCLNDEFFWLAHTPIIVERSEQSTDTRETRLLDFCLVP